MLVYLEQPFSIFEQYYTYFYTAIKKLCLNNKRIFLILVGSWTPDFQVKSRTR